MCSLRSSKWGLKDTSPYAPWMRPGLNSRLLASLWTKFGCYCRLCLSVFRIKNGGKKDLWKNENRGAWAFSMTLYILALDSAPLIQSQKLRSVFNVWEVRVYVLLHWDGLCVRKHSSVVSCCQILCGSGLPFRTAFTLILNVFSS